jgi:hypothetical protein
METGLVWIAFSMGGFVSLLGVLLSGRRSRDTQPAPFFTSSLRLVSLLLLVGFLATLPQKPPFTTGNLLGRGFLVGGLFALLAVWTTWRNARASAELSDPAPLALGYPTALSLAFLALLVPFQTMREGLHDALIGAGIGWTLIVYGAIADGSRPRPVLRRLIPPLILGLGYLVAVSTLLALGEARSPIELSGSAKTLAWSRIGLLFAATLPFLLFVVAVPAQGLNRAALKFPLASLFARFFAPFAESEEAERNGSWLGRLFMGVAPLLLVAWLLTSRLKPDASPFLLLSLGVLTGLVVWRIVAERVRANLANGWQHLALAYLVVLAGTMLAFQKFAGTGIGLWLLGVWLVLGFAATIAAGARDSDASSLFVTHLVRLLLFASLFFSYRLFTLRYDLHWKSGVYEQYLALALLVGAATPGLLAGSLLKGGVRPLKTLLMGAGALAIAALILLFFEEKCALWLIWGATFSLLFTVGGSLFAEGEGSAEEALLPILFSAMLCLALQQWTGHLLALSLTIALKTKVLLWVFGGIGVALLAEDYGTRLWNRRKAGEAK